MGWKYGTYGGEEIRYDTVYHYEDKNGIYSKIFIRRNTYTLGIEFQSFVILLNSPSYNIFYEMFYFENNFANFPPNTQNCIFFLTLSQQNLYCFAIRIRFCLYQTSNVLKCAVKIIFSILLQNYC